jgi:hypothetical protein
LSSGHFSCTPQPQYKISSHCQSFSDLALAAIEDIHPTRKATSSVAADSKFEPKMLQELLSSSSLTTVETRRYKTTRPDDMKCLNKRCQKSEDKEERVLGEQDFPVAPRPHAQSMRLGKRPIPSYFEPDTPSRSCSSSESESEKGPKEHFKC